MAMHMDVDTEVIETDVFVVSTPLQMLNAVEASHHFNSHKKVLVLIVWLEELFEQLEPVMAQTHWDQIYIVYWYRREGVSAVAAQVVNILNHRGIEKAERFLYRAFSARRGNDSLERVANNLGPIHRLFLGHCTRGPHVHFTAMVAHKVEHIVALDDGLATIQIHKERQLECSKSSTSNSPRARVQRGLWNAISQSRDYPIARLTFFTAYDIQSTAKDRVIKNNYTYLKSQISVAERTNDIWFLGQPLVQCNLLSISDYLELLEGVKSHFHSHRVIYLPHKGEDKQSLDMIAENCAMEIEYHALPVEVDLCTATVRPHVVASFYSSALYNCRVIFGDTISLKSFFIPGDIFRGNYESLDALYQTFESDLTPPVDVIR